MRVNTGYILFILCFLIFASISIIFYKKPFKNKLLFTLINICLFIIVGLLIYGLERFLIVPAIIIREGLHINGVSFFNINLFLVLTLLLGLITLKPIHK